MEHKKKILERVLVETIGYGLNNMSLKNAIEYLSQLDRKYGNDYECLTLSMGVEYVETLYIDLRGNILESDDEFKERVRVEEKVLKEEMEMYEKLKLKLGK